jgi:hypothetical protein
MAEVPAAAQFAVTVDDPVTGEIPLRRDRMQRPPDHSCPAHAAKRAGQPAVGHYPAVWNLLDQRIEAFNEDRAAGWGLLVVVGLSHIPSFSFHDTTILDQSAVSSLPYAKK